MQGVIKHYKIEENLRWLAMIGKCLKAKAYPIGVGTYRCMGYSTVATFGGFNYYIIDYSNRKVLIYFVKHKPKVILL